jgi:hypothetical protein
MNYPEIFPFSEDILSILLLDRTTDKNILWATDDYTPISSKSQIRLSQITGSHSNRIKPRIQKQKEEQQNRTRNKAEVFTPSWICNAQNNLIDEAWFGRKNVFNEEIITPDGSHFWTPTEGKIEFPEDDKQKTWKKYVRDTRLEITCGEAPYLVSRYDTTTGNPIPIKYRIGLLDRKLRVISENVENSAEWLEMAQEAYKNTYGYEWQGDNLLLARESLLMTFVDYYEAKFGKYPLERSVKYMAYIISWNTWQMDGLKMVIPNSCDNVYETNLFGETTKRTCPACEKGEFHGHIGIPCIIRNWRKPKEQQKIQFSSLITNI